MSFDDPDIEAIMQEEPGGENHGRTRTEAGWRSLEPHQTHDLPYVVSDPGSGGGFDTARISLTSLIAVSETSWTMSSTVGCGDFGVGRGGRRRATAAIEARKSNGRASLTMGRTRPARALRRDFLIVRGTADP